MAELFGTDGIRGEANLSLTGELARQVGHFCGYRFSLEGRGKIIIGRDTRLSSPMLEAALVLGITQGGSDVYLTGVVSTPTIAYLMTQTDFDCGIMISASHNVFSDNGIKIFSAGGYKIDEKLQADISANILKQSAIPYALKHKIGRVYDYSYAVDNYYTYLKSLFTYDLSAFKIGLDLANGSATRGAKQLFSAFNAQLVVINDQPDGVNINHQCGSTHLSALQALVLKEKCDVGFAFDGDADRMLAVDANGEVVNGDQLLFILANYLATQGQLKDETLVITQMSNYGLLKALKTAGLNSVITSVGDKYVYEAMALDNYTLGGEQSGHMILKQHANTGDGQLAALKVLEVMLASGKSLAELAQPVRLYPQLLVNVPVSDKTAVLTNARLKTKVNQIEQQLIDAGRVLVRASGTENLIRVMVEAATDEICQSLVNEVVELINEITS